MGSKQIMSAVIVSLVMITLILTMVLYVNTRDRNKQSISVSEPVVAESTDSLHAFLEDETFFDDDRDKGYSVFVGDTLPMLYMQATSVYKDIRLTVTDEAGNEIKGISLFATVDGVGEFKDVDKDGLISIPDLSSGEYYVSLNPVQGYVVPTEPMRVSVKGQLEYKVIDDISRYIFAETEIDASQEDTEVVEAVEEADETEVKEIKRSENTTFGIDVSGYQKDIDWARVKAAGVEFAIIRVGYRGSKTGAIVEDSYFKRNIEGANEAGVQAGIYFFTQAVTETEAVEEASAAIELIKDYKIDYPVFIDTEGAGGNGRADNLDIATRTQVIQAFCKTIESAGYHAGVYASRNWFYHRVNASELEEFVIWDAEYISEPKYEGKFDLWQYTSSGMIDGINTRVDLDLSYIEIN